MFRERKVSKLKAPPPLPPFVVLGELFSLHQPIGIGLVSKFTILKINLIHPFGAIVFVSSKSVSVF